MSRPLGRRNADFDKTRAQILGRVVRAVAKNPEQSSFAELADVSGVSRTTLRHYFQSRDDLLHAMLEHMRVLGEEAENAFPISSELPLEEALRSALQRFVFAWRVGVGSLFVAGLVWGLADAALGPSYVANILEPMLTRFEQHLAARLSHDGLDAADARHAALALVSPIVVALLHQESLHGVACRPLDMAAFVESHLQRFLVGWFATSQRRPAARKRK